MIKFEEDVVTIKCDKCQKEITSDKENYNKVFWDEGFVLNHGRKYEHLCFDCLPKKKQRAIIFVKNRLSF